jgi:lipoprotein-anchoring transpeptidase ErfK/SrfK
MKAAAAGDLAKVRSLTSAGAAVDACDARGHTAVWHAVDARQPDTLALLLEKAQALPGRCPLGRGALERALDIGDWELIQPVLDAGRSNLGWTRAARRAVAKAINDRAADHVKALAGKHWRDPVMEGSRHPILAHAIVSGDVETTTFLLDCGFDPRTRIGNLADKEFADKIPQKFIRYYAKQDRGVNVLMLATGMERVDLAKLLIERGAKPESCTLRYKMAPLSFAAELNNHDMMRVLIGSCPKPEELRVEISLSSQRATLYRNGQAVDDTAVSTGVEGKETKPGRFLVTNKEAMHVSSIYKGAKMPFFMRLNCADFGMHQGVVTGAPASHGCIRLPEAIARRWYAKVPVGTEVNIVE